MDNNANIGHPRIAIIGAGAAGLTAGLVAGRNGLSTVIFEAKNAGGRAGGIPYIESFPGLGRVKGTEFMKSLKKQLEGLDNVELHELEAVKEIKKTNGTFTLITNNDEYEFDRVILAMGTEHKHLGAPGEAEFKGRGVSYCAACDGLFFRNKNTVVVGNDTHAVEQALFLNELGSNVTLVSPDSALDAEPKLCDDLKETNVEVLNETSVAEIYGERLVAGAKVTSPEQYTSELEAKGVFISVGLVPRTELLKDLGVELNAGGYIKTTEEMQTNIPNLYAIGDLVASDLEQVSICSTGANAVKTILKKR